MLLHTDLCYAQFNTTRNNMKINQKKIILSIVALSLFFAAGVMIYYQRTKLHIYDYNPLQDKQGIVTLFEKDKYWLSASPNYSPEFMLEHKNPYKSVLYDGKLHIKVAREHNAFAGFTAYYMESKDTGKILFLAVDHAFRGKGFGKTLTQYAIDQLKKMGAKQIVLTTRTTNYPAQKIYESVGFKEVLRDAQGYLYYSYE